jgi:hypothetical protein
MKERKAMINHYKKGFRIDPTKYERFIKIWRNMTAEERQAYYESDEKERHDYLYDVRLHDYATAKKVL